LSCSRPLPTPPEPPRFPPDDRQSRFQGIVGRLGDHGFPASALNVGRLKEALESGIVAFDMPLVAERWDADVSRWMGATLMAWVQRCKSIKFDKRERGLRVEIETQDDLGYYEYAFDVFPGSKHTSP
jgi:hypothetical protein